MSNTVDDVIDITPDTHFLESIRSDRGSYWALLAEGVDNSFDANATEIKLVLSKQGIGIQDNGIGITRDRELSIVRLGEHRSMPTTALGRFGIGLKYHAVNAGDRLDVESISSDGHMSLYADWAAVIKHHKWQIERPKWMPAIHNVNETGTQLRIGALRWPAPTPKDIKACKDMLAQWFYPALINQRSIVLNDEPIAILREPDMTDRVECDINITADKRAHVRGGIVVDRSATSLYGVQLSYKHRVISPNSAFGCDGFSGLRQMFARVELIGPWKLTRFKDGLTDRDEAVLEEELLNILRPILEKCHAASMSADIDNMTTMLNDMLPPELAATRPPHKRPRAADVVKKRGKRKQNGLTKEGDESPTGPARKLRSSPKLLIAFESPLVQECGYGKYQAGHPGRVVLASDNPHIASLLALRDKPLGAQNLYAIALSLYLSEKDNVPLFNESFGLKLWQMTERQKLGDDSQLAS